MDTTRSDVYEQLIAAAIRFVSFRPRSERELRVFLEQKLKKRHITAPLVVPDVLRRLAELGYADDAKFAAWWVDQRTGRKPKGAQAIRGELLDKGVARGIIDRVIGEGLQGERSERALALAAAQAKAGLWKMLPVAGQKQKLSQYLLRRGFASDTVWGVIDDIIGKE